MPNHKLEFKLAQQTPLIHFQHDHQGATLRASEVKPKLDKFIIKKLGGFDAVYDDREQRKWFIEYHDKANKADVKKKPALNYKMSFYQGKVTVENPPKYGLYYGNMGNHSEKALYVLGNCKITIICFNTALKNTIDNYIHEFFIVTNFGRMQSKGFGSYIVEGNYDSVSICKYLAEKCSSKYVYYFQCKATDDKTKEYIFKKIKALYSVMKSGYNINDKYHRSFLFDYFHTIKTYKNKELKTGLGNEKAYMKKEKLSPWKDGKPYEKRGANRKYSDWNDDMYLYLRSVLGVGDHIDYIKDDPYYNDQGKKIVPKTKISIRNSEINRLSSPVFFKIINDVVYFAGERINSKIFNKDFVFTNQSKQSLVISTPSEFDIDEFLEYFYDNYNPYEQGFGIFSRIKKYTVGGAGE